MSGEPQLLIFSAERKLIGNKIVGQGIFKLQRPTRRFQLPLRQGKVDPRNDRETWTRLVSRSLLFRVHPDLRPHGVQSGTAVCIMEKLDDGTECAKVAGFMAFAQDVSAVQSFDMEGEKLYKRLAEGRVAFYGAFQVPEKLREEHIIL